MAGSSGWCNRQPGTCNFNQLKQLFCDLGCKRLGLFIAVTCAAKQDCSERAGEMSEARCKASRTFREFCRRYTVHRSTRIDDVRSAQTIMARRHDKVKIVQPYLRILDVDSEAMPGACFFDCFTKRYAAPAARYKDTWPWGSNGVAVGSNQSQRTRPDLRGEALPRSSRGNSLNHSWKSDSFCQAQRLVLYADRSFRDHPAQITCFEIDMGFG